jgi:hypothetical protein
MNRVAQNRRSPARRRRRTGPVGAARAFAVAMVALLAGAQPGSAAGSAPPDLIAFVRGGDIWTVPSGGGAASQLTFTGDNAWPAWSPDGWQIAFDSRRAGSWDIWVMNADGSGLRRVTIAPSAETHATWSPDGRWIAFSSDRDSWAARPAAPLGPVVGPAGTVSGPFAAASPQGSPAKPPMQGLVRPSATTIQQSHIDVMEGVTVYANWRDLQDTSGSTLSGPDVGKIDGALAWAAAAGKTVKIRLFTGASYGAVGETAAPPWLVRQVGTFGLKNSMDPVPVTQIACFWKKPFLDAYDHLMQLMAARWDGNPTLRDITVSGAMTTYAEPFIRDMGQPQNRAEMVGGGVGWDGSYIAPPGAGYSDAANQAAHRSFIDSHARWWVYTSSSLAFNPYQVLKSQSEAGIRYQDGNQVKSFNDPALTRELIDYFKSRLGDRGVLENNSVREQYFTYDASGHAVGLANTGYKAMFEAMRAYGPPSFYQTAQDTRIGDFNRTLDAVIDVLRGNAVEPPGNFGLLAGSVPPQPEYLPQNFAGIDRRLLANPLPAGAGGGSAPDVYSTWFGHDSTFVAPQSALFKLRSTAPYGIAVRLTTPEPVAGGYTQDLAPAWSPQGDAIMFTRRSPSAGGRQPATYRMMTIPADGGTAAPLNSGSGNAWLGVWAPATRTIAWSSDAASAGSLLPPLNILVMTAAGRIRPPITADARTSNGAASWSPDGSRIAYVRSPVAGGADSVWTVGANGLAADFVAADATQPSWRPAG